jgi:nitrogen fixation protein FixH
MSADRRPGWWYPYIFIGVFAMVMAVNLVMVWLAGSTFPGMSIERPYEKGLAFNLALEEARRQDALGWTVETSIEPSPGTGAGLIVAQLYRDRAGRPIEGLTVRVRLTRPTGQDLAQDAVLIPGGPGHHAALIPVPLPGQWDLRSEAEGNGGSFRAVYRFVAP